MEPVDFDSRKRPAVPTEEGLVMPKKSAGSRRKIEDWEWKALAEGRESEVQGVYVGRGGHGVKGSVWANPYKTPRDGTREEVVRKFGEHLVSSGLYKRTPELGGKVLLCHCKKNEKVPCRCIAGSSK